MSETVEFEYPAKVEDSAPSTKKVTIDIPAERIAAKLNENFKDIRSKAALPGFRPGKAPQKLIEKRFGTDIRKDVRDQLVREAYQSVIQKQNLDVVGEPEFANPEGIILPESGGMSFSFEIEVRPAFELPELKGIAIKKPKVELTEEHINQAMNNLREQQGMLVPVEDRGLEAKDRVTADFTIFSGGNQIAKQENAQFVLQAGRVAGIFIEDIDKQLAGVKAGESKKITVKAPADHPREEIRDKEVEIEVAVKDIKKLELAEVNQEFLDSLGFKDEAELREALKEQMQIRITNDVQQNMRDQVVKYLLDNVKFDLPSKLSTRQEQRIVQRRASDLYMRGIPVEQIEANIEAIKAGAGEQAATELKSFFILDKIATKENVDVTEEELNGQIAMAAMQTGERPEKLKQRLAKEGTLQNMYLRMRENKAVDKVLETATIEEVAVPEPAKA